MVVRLFYCGVLVGLTGCVEVPELLRNNPCDPAVTGTCQTDEADRGVDALERDSSEVAPDADASSEPDAEDAARDSALDGQADAADTNATPDSACPGGGQEACNGVDDDCDGQIDELTPIACYPGPVETRNVGVCSTGTINCEDGSWTVCNGATVPDDEACDGVDNDCDGVVDENVDCD